MDMKSKKLNQQVKRNIERFPQDFMFQLTENEMIELSSVLRGPIAVKQSIHIVRVFVKTRHYITQNKPLLNNKDLLMFSLQNKNDIEKSKALWQLKKIFSL